MDRKLHRKTFAPNASGPLSGVRVLDLSRVLVGNALTASLADYGAEVIKVEQPGAGDGLRQIEDGGVPVFWKVLCRNKKSIAIDLKHPNGIALVLELVRKSDVLVENFRPGTLDALGLGWDVLAEANPKLVLVCISGWGNTGPYREKLGFGTLIEAFSGLAAKTGFPDSPPLLPSLGLADLVCGLNGAFATIVALREAEKEGGVGQVIDLSILDSMAALLAPDAGAYSVTGQVPPRMGNGGMVAAPRNLYRTSDGAYIALSASTQTMYEKLMKAIGHADLISDPRFLTNSDRVTNSKLLDSLVQEFIGARTLQDNLDFFDGRKVTVGPVNDIARFMNDPHVIEREILVDMEDPDLAWLPMPQPAARLSRTPASIRSPAPTLGEHTRQVLTEAGLSAAQIGAYIDSGTVAVAGA